MRNATSLDDPGCGLDAGCGHGCVGCLGGGCAFRGSKWGLSRDLHHPARAAVAGGGAIACRAHLAPRLGGVAETATGVATVNGQAAHCTVEFPLRWAGGSGTAASYEGALSYEIDALSGPGAPVVAVRAEQRIGVAFPASNSNTSLQITCCSESGLAASGPWCTAGGPMRYPIV